MESDLQQQHPLHQHHLFHSHPPPPPNPGGLSRFRSAPSSFFDNLLDKDFFEDFLNRPSSPETGRILSRLISGEDPAPAPPPPRSEPAPAPAAKPPRSGSIKSEADVLSEFSSAPYYQSSSQPPLPKRGTTNYGGGGGGTKMGRGNNSSSLIRQSSSPAGLFSNINIDEMLVPPAAARFGNHPESLARVSSSMAQLTPIVEIGDKRMGENIQDVDPFGDSNEFVTGFPIGSWDDSDNYNPLKRGRDIDIDIDEKHFAASEAMNEDIRPPQMLAHHLSLPNTSAEVAAIEKILQESVPCKIRAKRGCATHPRSIAERVRRTKISERMRKLQDLVPNMDKQTNTSDMLDLAVEHIKDLQQQVKMLSANRAACTCATRHQL